MTGIRSNCRLRANRCSSIATFLRKAKRSSWSPIMMVLALVSPLARYEPRIVAPAEEPPMTPPRASSSCSLSSVRVSK